MRAAALLLVVAACGTHRPPRPTDGSAPLTISVEQQSVWVRNFNPLLPPGQSRWPTRCGVYEPLLVYNPMTAAWTPWLATAYAWSPDLLHLDFTVRDGVLWSDGAPFTADDVVYTFALLRAHPALDLGHVWGFLADVRAPDPHTVELTFSRPYVPGLEDVAHQPIVPRHVWEHVDDPMTFANPDPIGTGPYTEVVVFRDQVYELGRNPHYWQPGKPAVPALRFPAYPSNDQADLALIEGDVDWSGNFVPAVDRTFVARDRDHHESWSPLVGAMVLLYANTTRPPFDDVRVREAMSMAIDRARLVDIAMYGMTRPADATGLTDGYHAWHDADAGRAGWVEHDPDGARRLLAEAGVAPGSIDVDLEVVSGWSDWVRAAQLVARDLEEVGVHAHVRVYDFGAWMSRLQDGSFSLSIGYSQDGPTPYRFYRSMMSNATGNWQRFTDARADALLADFERTPDFDHQRAIAIELERRFAETAPAIPLFANPLWGEASSERFAGFPSAADPFARLSPNVEPDPLLILTNLEPR